MGCAVYYGNDLHLVAVMLNLLIGTISVSVDWFFPADPNDIDKLMSLGSDDQMIQIVEYLQEKVKGLEDNIKYIQERLNK